jgi:hypothetical protein
MQNQGDVRFIRKNGRIIPIRSNQNDSSSRKPKGDPVIALAFRKRKISAADRLESGFKAGAQLGGMLGATLGSASVNIRSGSSLKSTIVPLAKGTIRGAAIGSLALGVGFGAINAAFGSRQQTQVGIVGIGRYVKPKKKK